MQALKNEFHKLLNINPPSLNKKENHDRDGVWIPNPISCDQDLAWSHFLTHLEDRQIFSVTRRIFPVFENVMKHDLSCLIYRYI